MMSRFLPAVLLFSVFLTQADAADPLGKVLDQENQSRGVTRKALPAIDDLTYLRRVTIDLVGRIPTADEIQQFEALPASSRRQQAADRLLSDERFADRWTVFFADMLRIRRRAEGGNYRSRPSPSSARWSVSNSRRLCPTHVEPLPSPAAQSVHGHPGWFSVGDRLLAGVA